MRCLMVLATAAALGYGTAATGSPDPVTPALATWKEVRIGGNPPRFPSITAAPPMSGARGAAPGAEAGLGNWPVMPDCFIATSSRARSQYSASRWCGRPSASHRR